MHQVHFVSLNLWQYSLYCSIVPFSCLDSGPSFVIVSSIIRAKWMRMKLNSTVVISLAISPRASRNSRFWCNVTQPLRRCLCRRASALLRRIALPLSPCFGVRIRLRSRQLVLYWLLFFCGLKVTWSVFSVVHSAKSVANAALLGPMGLHYRNKAFFMFLLSVLLVSCIRISIWRFIPLITCYKS